jgi:hypothetical protein
MLRDVPNISNAFDKEGFDPPICNHIRNVNTSFLLVDLVDCRDELVVTVPPAILFTLPPPITVLSLIRGFSLRLTLTFAKDCPDGLLVGGMACHEVEQLLRCPWFAASKLMDEFFIGRAGDERSDHVYIHDIRKLIALLGKATDVLA